MSINGWLEAAVSQWAHMCNLADRLKAEPDMADAYWPAVRAAALRLIEILAYAELPASNGMWLDAVHVLRHRKNRQLANAEEVSSD